MTTPATTGKLPTWEQLNCYRFNCFPERLIVTTNAPVEILRACAAKFAEMSQAGEGPAIEELIRQAGYFAVTGWEKNQDLQTL